MPLSQLTSSQPAQASQLSSASSAQPSQLSQLSSNCTPKWYRSWIDLKSSQRSFFEGFCRRLLGCSQNLDLESQPDQLSHVISATSAQQGHLSQLSSGISAQPAQLKIVLQSSAGAGLTQNRVSDCSLKGFVVVFWGAFKTWIWGVSQLSSAISSQPSQLSQLSSASSAQPSQLSQLSSAISAQPFQLSQLRPASSGQPASSAQPA